MTGNGGTGRATSVFMPQKDVPVLEIASDDPDEQKLILSSMPPSAAQKRLALAVVFSLIAAFFITVGPLSSLRPPQSGDFILAYTAAMVGNNLITAILLFAQFSILRTPAVLVISSGYLFTALTVIPWMLTFPGVFAPEGLLGAGPRSSAWLYMLWHAGFSLSVVVYALMKHLGTTKKAWKTSHYPVMLAGVAVIAVVCTATFLVTKDNAQLPALTDNIGQLSPTWKYVAGVAVLMSLVAIMSLWIRQPSVLDLWLMVVMCSYVIEILLIRFPVPGRYTVGWYAGRLFGLLAGSFVLIVLLYEITTLYARLLHAVLTQRREREARLMTGNAVTAMIAHEVKQPLAGMTTNAYAGLLWLDRAVPNLDEAKAAFKKIMADGHRAGAVIDSIRALFKGEAQNRTSFDVNQLIEEALFFLRGDLQKHRITVDAVPNTRLPAVIGEPIQLRQVLLNLMTNAIDSMATSAEPRILAVHAELQNGDVLVSIADTGAGLKSEDVERVFNPLFTTKPMGMGMGLSLCRSILESHDSQLWVVPNTPHGAVFQFALHPDTASCAATNTGREGADVTH
jgi:signal transduction histidine kinase